MIYLIEKLWLDPMENHQADGYSPLGYVNTQAEAIHICISGRLFDKKDCWSLYKVTPRI